MKSIFEVASNISTPLALSGFMAAVLFFVFRQIVAKNIFPKLNAVMGGTILRDIINKLFILALIAMVLGFAGWVIAAYAPERQPKPPPDSVTVSLTSDMTFRQAAETVVEMEGQIVSFPDCGESDLNGKIKGGPMTADTTKKLLENLQYRLIGAGTLKYHVAHLKDRGLYEIHCQH
jgi:uncharacterized membrane protein YhdT